MKLRFLWMELKLRYLLRIMQCTLDKFFYLQGQIISYYALYIGQVILSSRSDSLLCNVCWTSSIFKVRFSLIMQCILDKLFFFQGQILSYYDENVIKALSDLASLENFTFGFIAIIVPRFCDLEYYFIKNINCFPLT